MSHLHTIAEDATVPERLPRFTVNCSILFGELPFLERPSAARSAGFDAIECWWPFDEAVPSDAQVDAFERAMAAAGVQLAALNFFAGDLEGGDRGVLSSPSRTQEFRANIDVAIEIGERLGCRIFNALYGNRIDNSKSAEQDSLAVENLALAAQAAAKVGGVVVIEPLSGAEQYPLLTAEDAVAVIEHVQREGDVSNLGVLADLYHLAVNGCDPSESIAKHCHKIAHVQIADSPGRNEPGTGELPISKYLTELGEARYVGWIGLEYRPSGASSASFDWLPREQRGRP